MTFADAVIALVGVVVITTALAVVVARDARFTVRDTIDVAALNAIILGLIVTAVLVVI
jgi:hypothetical protein